MRGASGEIELDSELGRGTAFTLIFPEAAPEAPGSAAPAREGRAGTETVLLVEDEEAVRRLAERVLTGHGYRVLSAPDASAARELWAANESQVGLLLSDITLPGISGPTLAIELSGDGRSIPMLFISGRLLGDPSIPPLPSGARFLPKPFSVAGLLEAVRAALDAPTVEGGRVTCRRRARRRCPPAWSQALSCGGPGR